MVDQVNAKQVQRVASQTGDLIQDIPYEGANTYDRKLPKAPLKALQLTMTGTFTPTFTSAPVATGKGVMSDLIEEIEIEDGVGQLVNLNSDDIRRLFKNFIGSDSPALYQKNASALTSPSVGFVEYGSLTTGQSVVFHESIEIPFENILAQANFLDTLLQYNGRKENIIRIKTRSLDSLNLPSNSTDASWASDITLKISPIVSGFAGPGKRWRRFTKSSNFLAPTDRFAVKLDEVENLKGIGIFVVQGQDKTPLTFDEMGKVYLTLKVKRDGAVTTLKPKKSLADIAYESLNKRQQSSLINGYGYMPLLQGGLIESALANQFEDIDLEIAMDSSLSNYASPGYTVRLVIDEIS